MHPNGNGFPRSPTALPTMVQLAGQFGPRGRGWLAAVLAADPALTLRRRGVASGRVLFEPDAEARDVYLVHRGQVRLYQAGPAGGARLTEILGPEEWFGVAALAGAERYGCRAVAVGPTVVTEVRADRLFAALARRPDGLLALVGDLAAKVSDAREDASRLVFSDCNGRLVQTLVRLSDSAAATRTDTGVVLRITHQQLAQAVGVARETISLALTQLRQRNLLRTGRNQVAFDPLALQRCGCDPTEN